MTSSTRRKLTITCALALTLLLVGGLFFPGGVRAFAEGLEQDVATSSPEPSDGEKDLEPAEEEATEPAVDAEGEPETSEPVALLAAEAPMLLAAPQPIPAERQAPRVTGYDTRSNGLTIDLFDYYGNTLTDLDGNYYIDTAGGAGINIDANGSQRPFRFFTGGTTASGTQGINNYTGGQDVVNQGILQSQLVNGYPVLNAAAGGSSLSYLFDPNQHPAGRVDYTDLNRLFQKDLQGYRYYDSDLNYAFLTSGSIGAGAGVNQMDFTLYDDTFQKEGSTKGIGFFPFDDYDSNANTVGPTSGKNHQFGLHMGGTFSMPPNSTVQGNDMVFKFSGDDDVWVFIDGVLVLDLGGIHQPADGEINFKTGEVTVSGAVSCVGAVNPINATTTDRNSSAANNPRVAKIADIFAAAGKTWDGSDFSSHRMDFFYLERGGYDSNCSLMMNLALTKPFDLAVEKSWEGGNAAHNADEIYVQLYTVSGTTETAVGDPVKLSSANGWKHTYSQLPASDDSENAYTYIVKEGTVSDGVFTPATSVTAGNGLTYTPSVSYRAVNSDASVTTGYAPNPANPTNGTATITNTPTVPTFDLAVDKAWTDGNANHAGDSVLVQLYRGDVAVGDKVTLDAAGNWTHTFQDLPVCDAAGVAYTYTVREVTADGTVVATLTAASGRAYANAGTTYGAAGSTTTNTTGYSTTIANPVNGTATITNEPLAKLTVNKVWTDGNANHADADAILVQLYRNGTALGDKVTLNATNGWTHDFTDLAIKDAAGAAYTYTAKEVTADGTVVTALTGANGLSYTVSDTTYATAGGDATNTTGFSTSDSDPADGTATITNVAPSVSIAINKVDATTRAALSDTTFELWHDENDGAALDASDTKVGTAVTTDANGRATFSNLAAGTYWIKETQAKAGYQVLSDPIRVEYDGTKVYFYASRTEATVTDNAVTVTIENSKIQELPTSGSCARALLASFGTFLLVGATCVAVTRRRESERL